MKFNINKRPQFVGATRANNNNRQSNFTTKQYKNKFDRALLPTPASYYCKQFPGLKTRSEWVKVRCCFHDDSTPSLNINMVSGHFKCHSCDAKGHDVIAFHMQRYNVNFPKAVTELGAWSHE